MKGERDMSEPSAMFFGFVMFLIAGLCAAAIYCAVMYARAANDAEWYLEQWKQSDRVLDMTRDSRQEFIDALNEAQFRNEGKDERIDVLQGELNTSRSSLTKTTKVLNTLLDKIHRFDPKTVSEPELLAQIVAAECGQPSSYKECRAVAQVILNRTDHGQGQGTLLEVIMSPGQFSPVTSGAWLGAIPNVIESAAAFNAWNETDGAPLAGHVLYFCAAGHENEFFRTLTFVATIGETSFYKEGT